MSFTVAVLHGPVASGKHTIGSEVSARLGWPMFHNHLAVDPALAMFPFGSTGFCDLREHIWRGAFAAAAHERQSFVFTFAPEASVADGLIDELAATVRAAGGVVHFIALTCAHKDVLARLANATRQTFGKLTDPDLYETLLADGAFAYPPLPAPLMSIDTSRTTAAVAAERIADTLAGQET